MAIPDPHAIPEDAHTCEEYLHEADTAWDGGDSDHAFDLYHSLYFSQFATAAATSHAAYRLGLIAQTRGDPKAADFFLGSSEPGAADALHAMTNATTNDPTPDPDVVPTTTEQAKAWSDAAKAAAHSGDWQRALGLYVAASQSAALAPSELGWCYFNAGMASENLGDHEGAVRWYEASLTLVGDTHDADEARKRIKALGGAAVGASGTTPSAQQVADGINAYENGDANTARTALQAALHLDGPDDQKARAQYYLGAMDYQAGHYADARNHIEAAVANAPEPEKAWAQAALAWRWDEHPADPAGTAPAAAAGATAPAAGTAPGTATPGAAAPGAPYSPDSI